MDVFFSETRRKIQRSCSQKNAISNIKLLIQTASNWSKKMTNKKTVTVFWGILAGLIAYAVVGKLGLYLLQIGWADYALRAINKSYSFEMLLARQLVGILASIAAGITTAKTTNGNGKTAWFVGAIVFCGASYIHFLTKTWNEYPVWYHFAYVLLIIPVIRISHFWVANAYRFKTTNR